MKTFYLQKKLAARILGIGINRVHFDPYRLDDVKEAITAEDIRELIKEKVITKKTEAGIKTRAGRSRKLRKKKGRRRSTGKIKKDVQKRKMEYIQTIRKLRKYIDNLKSQQKGEVKGFNKIKRLVKAGAIKNIKGIDEYLSSKRKHLK